MFLTAARQMVDIYDNMVLSSAADIEAILELVREQECIGLLTGYMVSNYGYTDVIAIPFQPEICTDIVLVTRNEKPSPLLRQFINHAREWGKQ